MEPATGNAAGNLTVPPHETCGALRTPARGNLEGCILYTPSSPAWGYYLLVGKDATSRQSVR